MIEPDFHSVGLLVPTRVHRAREQAMASLYTELTIDIDALDTRADAPHAGDDPDQFKLWASSMIWNLPTQSNGADNGNH